MSGTSLVVQGEREALLRPGEFALYDTSKAYSLLFAGGMDAVFFRLPRSALGVSARQLRDAMTITLGSSSAVAELTSAYLTRLAVSETLPFEQRGALIAEPTVELIRATIAEHLDDVELSGAAAVGALPFRIVSYMRAHLTDADLAPATVAAAHNISPRYLYQILSRCDIRFGEWVRQNRLEGARKDLARPACQSMTVSAVGSRWGFADSAHFSKVFKQEYGMSPRDWRHHQRLRAYASYQPGGSGS